MAKSTFPRAFLSVEALEDRRLMDATVCIVPAAGGSPPVPRLSLASLPIEIVQLHLQSAAPVQVNPGPAKPPIIIRYDFTLPPLPASAQVIPPSFFDSGSRDLRFTPPALGGPNKEIPNDTVVKRLGGPDLGPAGGGSTVFGSEILKLEPRSVKPLVDGGHLDGAPITRPVLIDRFVGIVKPPDELPSPPESNFDADGTIQLKLPASRIGNPGGGTFTSTINVTPILVFTNPEQRPISGGSANEAAQAFDVYFEANNEDCPNPPAASEPSWLDEWTKTVADFEYNHTPIGTLVDAVGDIYDYFDNGPNPPTAPEPSWLDQWTKTVADFEYDYTPAGTVVDAVGDTYDYFSNLAR